MQSKSRLTDFDIQTKLGSGSYGVIYRVVRRSDRKVYVLKQVTLANMKEKLRKNAINQATILSRLNSPFIVRYLQSFLDQNCLNIIMQYCEGGDLALLLKQQSGRPMKQDKIWKIFLQICNGLQYIHSKRILHRDVKTLNIFLTKDEMVKIGDLGVAKLLQDNADFAQTMVGTPFYLSPELCQQKPYNEKSDIWALGCLLYEMCTYKHPFEAANQGSLILKIVRGRYNPIPETYSKDLRETVESCLERDYKRRPTASVLLSRPALKQKFEQLGLNQLVDKYEGEESKRIFALQLEKELRKKQQSNQPNSQNNAQVMLKTPQTEKSKPIVNKIFQDVKNKKEDNVKKQDKKEDNRKEDQLKKERDDQQKKEQLQRKEQLRKEEQVRKEQHRREQARKQQLRKEEIQRKEQQRKKEEQLKRHLELQKRQQAQFLRRSEQKKKEEAKKQQELINDHHPKEPQQHKLSVEKVKYEREVSARVYQNKKSVHSSKDILKKDEKRIAPTPKLLNDVETPSAPRIIIKSKGFSNDESRQSSSHTPTPEFQPTSIKQSDKKQASSSQKKLFQHSNSSQTPMPQASNEQQARQWFSKKRYSEPKVLFGPGAVTPSQIPPLPPARIRKGAPSEKSRNSQNPIKPKSLITEQQERLVANLPDSQSSSDQEHHGDGDRIKSFKFKDEKNKSNGMKFKLKEIDNQEVLRRYEQLVEGKQSEASTQQQQMHTFGPVEESAQHHEQDVQLAVDNEGAEYLDQEHQAQHHQDSLQQQSHEFDYDCDVKEHNQDQQNFDQQQLNADDEQILEQPVLMQPQKEQWEFDQQPQLPAFEEVNPLLMEPQEQDREETRNYLQDKLAQNIKRQDELNQLMQLKIQECRKAFKSNYQEVISFFRKKINMESEYNEEDEKEVEQFLKSKKLTDAKKFQNIYKIMHFEMELENCRNIIQGICKKLNQLDK